MFEWLRKKKRAVEIDNSLEAEITQGRVSYVKSIKYDLVNKRLEVLFGHDSGDHLNDRVLTFEKVEEFSEDVYDFEDEGSIESLIGLDQYQMDYGVRYVIHTDVREVVFASKLEPSIEWTVSTQTAK